MPQRLTVWGLLIGFLTLSAGGLYAIFSFGLSERAAAYFDDPVQMQTGGTLRNLTGLQALDVVWRGLH